MSDDQRQLALPVDLGAWPSPRPAAPPPELVPEPAEPAEPADLAVAPVYPVLTLVTEPTEPTERLAVLAPAETSDIERTCWPSGSGASFSDDRAYRFELWRDTGIEYGPKGGPVAVIIGVNPSDAGEIENDPTITKDIGFAMRWGCAHMLKVNAYAFVATDPDDMRKAFAQGINIVGPDNNGVIRRACGVALLTKGKLVVAWGKNITPERQKEIYETIIRYCGVVPMCLGINKDGTPKHESRLAYATELVPWTCP